MRLLARLAIALLCLQLLGCIDPADRRPGLRLSAQVESEAVSDWSFANQHPEIYVETRTPWLLPHSVTIVCAAKDGVLYLGARNPNGKRWVDNIAHDPNVRLQIADRIYEQRLDRLDNPAEQQLAKAAYAEKYGGPETPPADAPEMLYYRVVDRS